MDIAALRARRELVLAQMREINAPPADLDTEARAVWEPTAEDLTRFETLDAEVTAIDGTLADIQKRTDRLTELAAATPTAVVGGDDGAANRGRFDVPNQNRKADPWDLDTVRFDANLNELRARAEAGLDADAITPGDAKEAAMRTLRKVDGDKMSVARRYLATGSDDYRSAFSKGMQGRMWDLTEGERNALTRAQSLTDGDGGFAVPFTLDPTIIQTDAGSISPIRELARVVQTTTDSWNGVSAGAATASWDAEATEVSDDAITLLQPTVAIHQMQVFCPFSIQSGEDWASIDSDLRMAMQIGRDNLEATAHIKGTGSGEPFGIEVALDGTASEISPATVEVFAAADVYNLQRVLPPRHRGMNPTWVMNIGTSNDIRQFDTGGGGNFWANLGQGTPETLNGWPWRESSEADDSPDINPAASEDNFILFVGAWQNYVIADRVGMTVELIPHLFATANNLPSGQRGLYGRMRTGADSVNDDAFRVLSVATTA